MVVKKPFRGELEEQQRVSSDSDGWQDERAKPSHVTHTVCRHRLELLCAHRTYNSWNNDNTLSYSLPKVLLFAFSFVPLTRCQSSGYVLDGRRSPLARILMILSREKDIYHYGFADESSRLFADNTDNLEVLRLSAESNGTALDIHPFPY